MTMRSIAPLAAAGVFAWACTTPIIQSRAGVGDAGVSTDRDTKARSSDSLRKNSNAWTHTDISASAVLP